ncbi:uncharacterized protein C8A04DRAFT_39138 [Dichotomopilus funicola]|uniref:AAA+ ATPase domain-containing protein n=1 Tax=Dichotomopilus funicola TaxID=1934379 RepID=A0AAN6ZL87_9PEZI|nr:hypothetical protein C8A04DRAFT_39138 [Dichotomopilus funicola]
MAENASPADNDISTARPPVHPFFAQGRTTTSATEPSAILDATDSSTNYIAPVLNNATDNNTTTGENDTDSAGENRGKRRKADQELKLDGTPIKTRPTKRTRNSAGKGDIENLFAKLNNGKEGDKTSRPGSVSSDRPAQDHNPQPETAVQRDTSTHNPLIENPPDNKPPTNPSPIGQPQPQASGHIATPGVVEGRPKKLLLFNPKTGTIGPPPKPKETRIAAEDSEVKKKAPGRRGRKSQSKIVSIVYGADQEARLRLAQLIKDILSGTTRHANTNARPSTKPTATATLTKPPKDTHPFFRGPTKATNKAPVDSQPKKPNASQNSSRTKQYCTTPCSPKKPRLGLASKAPMPQFGVKSLGLKFPGAKLPAWPWQGMVHVRGDEGDNICLDDAPLPFPARKSKGNAVKMSPSESIISRVADALDVPAVAKAIRDVNTEDFVPPPPEVRLPRKHFESGSKLQSRILGELKTFKSAAKAALPQNGMPGSSNTNNARPPPQLTRLFRSIASSLSAFDMSQCETTNWVQKYAPSSAAELLQPGQEVFFLRNWLQTLMVQSIDTGSPDVDKSKAGSKGKPSGAGKKKRRKKLDGFIVSSEDEDQEWYEHSEDDEDWAPSGSRGILRKTVVRSRNRPRGKEVDDKIPNTLVISGPHGCGKTAAVYAVAKELDFEVFEINASSRRSGKDVLERIGDMTRNHHVQQHQSSNAPDNQDATADDETSRDIKTGKQATMNSFFTAKAKVTVPKQTNKDSTTPPEKVTKKEAKKEPAKAQRQSLILLEEADILYEEDKQFWTTLVTLIAQAKRPFVITCNDETLVPLHTLTLHGIFRLSPPPRDLAIDRLLLIAANEGHALIRQSVEQLFDARHHDLRAATMDLQYWCQIGVGDRRGGFDWFYPRWPKGSDLDENQEVVRVVSQGTYELGMNLFGRDPVIDGKESARLVEEEVLHQAWESWGLDMGQWQDSEEMMFWATSLEPEMATRANRAGILEAYDQLADGMSVADMCSAGSFATFKEELIDTTQPDLAAKVRDDFVLGITHLEAPVIKHYSALSPLIASTIKSLAKSSLRLRTEKRKLVQANTLYPLNEPRAINQLQTSFTYTLPGTPQISRMDFAFAFDPIAAPDSSSLHHHQPVSYLEPSVFDRTLRLITLDVAPYVRGIIAYELHLQKQRIKLSSLVSEGGTGGPGSRRMRTTRAALSALEGGTRSATRGERWFKAEMNPYFVAKTAGKGWNSFEEGDLEEVGEEKGKVADAGGVWSDSSQEVTPKRVVQKKRKRKVVLEGEEDEEER